MKGFRSHHHPPSLDFSWRNVRKPAQNLHRVGNPHTEHIWSAVPPKAAEAARRTAGHPPNGMGLVGSIAVPTLGTRPPRCPASSGGGGQGRANAGQGRLQRRFLSVVERGL